MNTNEWKERRRRRSSASFLWGVLASILAQFGPGAAPAGAQLSAFSAPSQSYYSSVDELYGGNYRDAQRDFLQELRGAVKTVSTRWIDSICYHAMLGETYYHMGRLADAMEQFNAAANLYLQYPKWMLRVNFPQGPRVDAHLSRVAIPWGTSQRGATRGLLTRSMLISQGLIDNRQAVQQGGVVQPAQFWSVDVVEVNRCLALMLRRRNELLGLLGKYDSMSQRLLRELSRGGAPPNHWSGAWVEINRGIAHAGVGEIDQALEHLERGILLGDAFDHPLTCVALLEQGRLQMERGAAEAADQLFAEASYAAFAYDDVGVIDEAFRLASINRLSKRDGSVNPSLSNAGLWARQKRYEHVASGLQLALAEELMSAGDWSKAAAAFAAGQARMGDAAKGTLGNWALYLGARLDLEQGRESGGERLVAALQGRTRISLRNFQIALANTMYDSQALVSRNAVDVYRELLADPSRSDVYFRLFDALAVMKTPHQDAFDRWLEAAQARDDVAGALEAVDQNKRRRFHQTLPWGGRLAAVRRLLVSPASELSPDELLLRGDLLLGWPALETALQEETALREELGTGWAPTASRDDLGKQTSLWRRYDAARNRREELVSLVALERVPAPFAFPPRISLQELQTRLKPGEGAVVFHDAPGGMWGFLLSNQGATHWNCGPSSRLAGLISEFLRTIGNYDGNREMTIDALQSNDWHVPAERLYHELFDDSSLDPEALQELVVVPDGALWYVPFESLVSKTETHEGALIGFARIRYAPTLATGYSFREPWRRVQRSGLMLGESIPGDDEAIRREAIEPLCSTLEHSLVLPPFPRTDGPLGASLLDQLVLFDDSELSTSDPWSWTPFALQRTPRETLGSWLALAGNGPQRLFAPCLRTVAERGGKPRAGRRGGEVAAPGDELFTASCALISSGAETLLLSRWRVGGQSSLDLVREFAQELPYSSASTAWQRSVQLAAAAPVDPLNEMRVKASPNDPQITANHPFFWAGYLVVDTGWPGPPQADEPAKVAP